MHRPQNISKTVKPKQSPLHFCVDLLNNKKKKPNKSHKIKAKTKKISAQVHTQSPQTYIRVKTHLFCGAARDHSFFFLYFLLLLLLIFIAHQVTISVMSSRILIFFSFDRQFSMSI